MSTWRPMVKGVGRGVGRGVGVAGGSAISRLTYEVDSDEIQLLWTPSKTFDEIQILRSETSGSGYDLIDTIDGEAVSYADDTWVYGTTYYYKIRGVLNSKNSDSSQITVTAEGIGFMSIGTDFEIT